LNLFSGYDDVIKNPFTPTHSLHHPQTS